jgi:hypothetical protein
MTTATPAKLFSLPGDGSRAPMTACRQNLARAITALADEIESLEETMRPAQRLGELGSELAQLDRAIAELKAPYEIHLGNWLAGGQVGERPQPSLKISTLEARRRLLAADVDAVRPDAELAHQRAANAVRERCLLPRAASGAAHRLLRGPAVIDGTICRMARAGLHMSQERLAELAGISVPAIHNFEIIGRLHANHRIAIAGVLRARSVEFDGKRIWLTTGQANADEPDGPLVPAA